MARRANYRQNLPTRGTKRPPSRSLKSKIPVSVETPPVDEIDPYNACPPPGPGWNSNDWYNSCLSELRI